jgi:hypothetical protein
MVAARAMIERIVIETETPGDSRTMFRVRMNDLVIGEKAFRATIDRPVRGDFRSRRRHHGTPAVRNETDGQRILAS